MSDSIEEPPKVPSSPETLPPERSRSGCVTGLMLIVGGILLLPGLCALVFSLQLGLDGVFGLILLVCLSIGAVGILMIVTAVGRIRS